MNGRYRKGDPHVSTVLDEAPAHRAREALARHQWREAYDLMVEADGRVDLTPEDLEVLAESAWWVGEPEMSREAWERASTLYAKAGRKLEAANASGHLAFALLGTASRSILAGWLNKGDRLLQDVPESPVHGLLAAVRGMDSLTIGALDAAVELGKRALDIGTRHNVPDVMAMGLHIQGRALVAMGRVEEGMALLDEATAAAVSGELSPNITGAVYCSTVSACWSLADYGRAGEWTEAAERWCRRRSINGFPGLCRVHRAQVMKLRGAWREAEGQALLAAKELPSWFPMNVGWAMYEIGEIRMRTGDVRGAEEAFQQSHEAGHDPQPGLALLHLGRGEVEAATIGIRQALESPSQEPSFEAPPNSELQRAFFLPAQVEIALAGGDRETAARAAEELERLAATYGSPALRASAATARGAVQLRDGEAGDAQRSFRLAVAQWQELGAPYEVARARMALGDAYRAAGSEDQAAPEYRAAYTAFDRLGAAPDARRAAEALGEDRPATTTDEERVFRAFMFTDIVRSTNLVDALGDEAWSHLIRWHDEQLRSLIAANRGEVVKLTGDGFFVAFESTPEAFECAVGIQRALEGHRRTHGFAPEVRIGVHAAEATREGQDYQGRGVNLAARIGALAQGAEIAASLESAAGAPARLTTSTPRSVALKGFSEPVEVVTLEWR
jgi:class 3 adenylate cyclase